MASSNLPPPTTARASAPITCIQPGGGFGLGLALAWGRLRRAWLRLARPGYVREMAQKRQGPCDCGRDVIDTRDLKWHRNVCRCSFVGQPDPFHGEATLPLARAGLMELAFFSATFVLLLGLFVALGIGLHLLFFAPAVVFGALAIFVVSFFRDPWRNIPTDPAALLSPADGTITDVGEVVEADFPGGRAFRIGIFLSVFNVHVNRLPRSGRVLGVRYFPGRFLDARRREGILVNEQLWIDLGEGRAACFVRVKQIAGAIARRIVCWLRAGEEVRAGDRYGMIKFGSRTEVYVGAETVKEVLVKVGDSVRGGSSVLLRLKQP